MIFKFARATEKVVAPRPFITFPIAGLIVGGLAVAFAQLTDQPAQEVLFSGQDQLPGLISSAGNWTLGALALLVAFKGVAWAISLASFRGGPTFPAMYLGAAAGVMAAQLPGYEITPAVAVGIGAGVAAVLRLPLSAVALALLLTSQSGPGSAPLVVFGVVVGLHHHARAQPSRGGQSPRRGDDIARPGRDGFGMSSAAYQPRRPTSSSSSASAVIWRR